MSLLRSNHETTFIPLPDGWAPTLHWPTDNHFLFTDPDRFFARTKANSRYGRPGWTRDCGKRFHRGCDIAPVHVTPDNATHTVIFSDCDHGTEYSSDEPGWFPHDTIYAVANGNVVERNDQAEISTLGRYLIIQHALSGCTVFSLYAHLDTVAVTTGIQVRAGDRIATMGQTSSSADARTWMAIAPHLHLEFWDEQGRSFDPEVMLRTLLVKT
jgi:hypothetical protein